MGLKKIGRYLFLIIGFLVFLEAQKSVYAQNVAIVIGNTSEAVSLALKGFKDVYKKSPPKEYDLQRALALTHDYTIYQKIKGSLGFADLVLVIGDEAAAFVKEADLSVPIVFILVREYEKYGLGRGNTCGVTFSIPIWEQLDTLKKAAPNVKKVGVIYEPKTSREIIDKAKEGALGLGLEIVVSEAESKQKVAEAIRDLEGKIDAFLMINDPLVANTAVLQRLLLFTLTYKIPLVVVTPSMVERGGLFSLSPSYEAVGRKAGEIVTQIISGKNPVEIGVQPAGYSELVLNLKTARTIGLSIPQTIINQAARVYE